MSYQTAIQTDWQSKQAAQAFAAQALATALTAIVRITDGSQPIDHPGALMVARAALAEAQA